MELIGEYSCPIVWPMGAESVKEDKLKFLWEDENYVAEIKIDGERITSVFTPDRMRVFTRAGSKLDPTRPIEVTHRWPQIQVIHGFLPVGTILDGEAFSRNRRASEVAGFFNHRSEATMPDDIQYIAFDCLQWNNKNIENEPWHIRRRFIENCVNIVCNPILNYSAVTAKNKREFFESIVKGGGEGVVLKHSLGKYYQGKSPANVWVKVKKKDSFDCVITGFKISKEGQFKGMVGSVELSQYRCNRRDGTFELVKVCNASGINRALREELTCNPQEYLGRVALVEAFERIPNSVTLREPRIKFIRPEGSKSASACIIEGSRIL